MVAMLAGKQCVRTILGRADFGEGEERSAATNDGPGVAIVKGSTLIAPGIDP
jgi:hypothetical protein